MQFEPNAGQTDQEVKFVSRGPGYTLFLTSTQAVLSLHTGSRPSQTGPHHHAYGRSPHDESGKNATAAELRMSLVGANPHSQIEGLEALPGTVNYFIGNKPTQWRTGIHPFAKVKYNQVYPGVDLVYYGNQRQLEYDFVVSPKGDPSRIALGLTGAAQLAVDAEGGLVGHLTNGAVRWHKPLAYQQTSTGKQEVSARYVMRESGQIGVDLGAYDSSKPLVIDPVLSYATYLGGTNNESVAGIARDGSGNAYIIGDTPSINYPTLNAAYPNFQGSNDVVVTKLNTTLSALVYSTYVGGGSFDYAGGIAVDGGGNAYLTGETAGSFPVVNAYDSSFSGGGGDAFVTKLSPSGSSLVFSTYLGGAAEDGGTAIAVDTNGNAYVAGFTLSLGTGSNPFPAPHGAYQGQNGGGEDAFVTKFTSTGSLVYSTFLGGNSDDKALSIAVDSAGNACVVGEVDALATYDKFNNRTPPTSNFPTAAAVQPVFNLGATNLDFVSDGFVTKLSSDGGSLIFSTFLGGSDSDFAMGIALDTGGKVYVTGQTFSSDFSQITTNAVQPVNGGVAVNGVDFPGPDAFITVLQPSGSLFYSTYFGGSSDDLGSGIAVDSFGEIYVAGQTIPNPDPASEDFPVTAGADQVSSAATTVGFVAKINPAVPGRAGVIYSSFVGGDANGLFGATENEADAITVDPNGNFYVAGLTTTTNFPVTPGAARATNAGGADIFVAKFQSPRDISVAMLASVEPVIVTSNLTYTIYVNNNSPPSSPNFTGVTNVFQAATNLQILSVTTDLATNISNGRVAFIIGSFTNHASKIMSVTCRAVGQGAGNNSCTLSSIETSGGLEPHTSNNVSVVVSTVLGIVDVRLTQTASPNPGLVTSNLVYTLNVQNKSSPYNNVATSITVTDTLPPQVTFVSASNSQGSFCFYDGTNTVWCTIVGLAVGSNVPVTITVNATNPGSANNFASATPFDFDSNPANNSSSLTTTVLPLADIGLGVTESPNPGYVGSTLAYTLAVTNGGPWFANNVIVTNLVPPGTSFIAGTPAPSSINSGVVTWNLGTMTSNSSAGITFSLVPLAVGNLTNTASAGSDAADAILANNSASVVTVVNSDADLSVSQIASPNTTLVTSNITLTVTIANNGPSTATGVRLNDLLPTALMPRSVQPSQGSCTVTNGLVSCNLGSLGSGGSATVTMATTARLDGVFTATAIVTANETDLSPNNNTNSTTVTINPNPTAPLLKITRVGTNVLLSWATNAIGYNLQSSPNLATNGLWTAVTNMPKSVGNQYVVTNSASLTNRFYRLNHSVALLGLSRVGTNVVISWSALAPPSGTLRSATDLTPPVNWSLVPNTPAVAGTQFVVTNSYSGTRRFYRLFF
jgi:uncharacterized repeat protein (TIGR01451 family)